MTRHAWLGMVIHWELCKRFQFDYTAKWYMYKLESVQKNETHKILWNFEIQTNHLIPATRPEPWDSSHNKRTCRIVDFAVSTDNREDIKKNKKRDKCLYQPRELKKSSNTKVTLISIVKELEELEIGRETEITALLRSAKILRKVLETWGDLLSLRLQGKTIR